MNATATAMHTPAAELDSLCARGKEAAARFLVRRGYTLLARDWECSAGCADIIAFDENDTLVFIEVETRKGGEDGFPAEKATDAKRARYEKIALAFLKGYDKVDFAVRFDIINIVTVSDDRALIRHWISAFGGC